MRLLLCGSNLRPARPRRCRDLFARRRTHRAFVRRSLEAAVGADCPFAVQIFAQRAHAASAMRRPALGTHGAFARSRVDGSVTAAAHSVQGLREFIRETFDPLGSFLSWMQEKTSP